MYFKPRIVTGDYYILESLKPHLRSDGSIDRMVSSVIILHAARWAVTCYMLHGTCWAPTLLAIIMLLGAIVATLFAASRLADSLTMANNGQQWSLWCYLQVNAGQRWSIMGNKVRGEDMRTVGRRPIKCGSEHWSLTQLLFSSPKTTPLCTW